MHFHPFATTVVMPYSVLLRMLTWDGKTGEAHYGDTRRTLQQRPRVGIPAMTGIRYVPLSRIYFVSENFGPEREMTLDECLGIEDRLYGMDRGAGDPWRDDNWPRAPMQGPPARTP